jgi:altronate dehydratase small subunit
MGKWSRRGEMIDMEAKAILIKPDDNVATALVDIAAGQEIVIQSGENRILLNVKAFIPSGHKFAVMDIARGDSIIKYGEIIGRATADIQIGSHAHIQNIESMRGRGDREDG